ncbi:MAG: penicillin-binding transpeptidase domain-containing protein [Pyrinomonadaceae bacterium]
MMLFLLQFNWENLRPEKLFGVQVLERTPAGLSIAYLIGILLVIFFLIVGFLANFSRPRFNFELELSKKVKRKLSSTATNRSLRLWQVVFFALAIAVFGYHCYWTYWADEYNEQFQALSYKDLRYRRTTAANLRGWMLDRSGRLDNALAYYKVAPDGEIVREYSLDREMAHLLGTERGTPGLERTIFRRSDDPMPEAWTVLTKIKDPAEEQRDVKITIDYDLQRFAAEQLDGKLGAVVVLNPQTGDVLAMYSNPSFKLSEAQTLDDWLKLEGNLREKPLLNRALREYYAPGSTFKTFTMLGAFRNNLQNQMFLSRPEGFIPFRGSRSILDAVPPCEPPFGCTNLNIAQAFEASSNQYFAQMAVRLGRERIAANARNLSISAVETPADALRANFYSNIWNTSQEKIANALAPRQSTIVTGSKINNYDIGLEGMGQGYAGQMTPFQMALVASAAANLNGQLMKPKIELDQPPQVYAKVVARENSAKIREIMSLVTEGGGGTATRVFGRIRAAGIRSGGKTGTAEKEAPVFDKQTGRLKTITRKRKDADGNVIEYRVPVMYKRTDSWYISIAPVESPQLAIAVVVEGGGYGASVAAPIAANIILKARELGLMGEKYTPKVKTQTSRKKNSKGRKG